MPPKNEDTEQSWREYRLLVLDTQDRLKREVEWMHDELLTLKVKCGIWGGLAGVVIAGGIEAVKLLVQHIK